MLSKGVPWAGFLPGIWATLRAVASAVRGPQPPAWPLQPAGARLAGGLQEGGVYALLS